jgi:hypothetical protein
MLLSNLIILHRHILGLCLPALTFLRAHFDVSARTDYPAPPRADLVPFHLATPGARGREQGTKSTNIVSPFAAIIDVAHCDKFFPPSRQMLMPLSVNTLIRSPMCPVQ